MARARAAGVRSRLRRLLSLLRPPRRLRLRRAGGFLVLGTFALGLAALNTGNNLLYLMLGALLGTIALSGWLSEQALRDIGVRRSTPRAATAGTPAHVEYHVHNRKDRLPSHGIELREMPPTTGSAAWASASTPAAATAAPDFETAFVATLEPAARVRVRAGVTAPRRGIHPLPGVVLCTAFPFGLFEKERDVLLPGTLTVWPRTDRPVRAPRIGGAHGHRRHAGAGAAAGAERGDYRALREYRPGDDPRDIHWRSTARRGAPILRQYDRAAAEQYWLVLDTVAPTADLAEAAVETAAAVAAQSIARGDVIGLAAGAAVLPPGHGSARLDVVLDILAGVTMLAAGEAPRPPAAPRACVLITARGGDGDWGDVYRVREEAAT
jgi:uncharacterized protein (DUF58 family)